MTHPNSAERASDATVTRVVADWLEAERVCALNALRAGGLPSRVIVDADVGTLDREKQSIGTETERREVNALTLPRVAWSIRGRARPAAPAAALVAEFGRRCWVAGLLSRYDFDSEPAAWLEEAVLRRFADEYLRSLWDIEVPGGDQLRAAVKNLVAFLEADTIVSHEDFPLEGIDVDAAIAVGGATLRPLTADELGALHNTEMTHHMVRARRSSMLGMERVMLEVTDARSKEAQRRTTTRIPRIILALQLLGFDPAGTAVLQQRDRPVSTGTLTQPLVLPYHAGTTTRCTAESFRRSVELADLIAPTIDDPRTPHEVALHRFQQGCADRAATDAIVDFVICLEAVLLPRESAGDIRFQGELRFRFALHGARLLGRHADEARRRSLRRELTEIYDTRSTVVHGGSLDRGRLTEVRTLVRSLAAAVLIHGLESGWPTAQMFADLVLE